MIEPDTLVEIKTIKHEDRMKKRKQLYSSKILSKKRSSNIKKWANDIQQKGLKTLQEIQKYLSDKKTLDRFNDDDRIIATVINCKQKGKNITFKDNLFDRALRGYVVGKDIKTRFITNDHLHLAMIYNKLAKDDEDYEAAVDDGTCDNVTVITDNFSTENEITTGFIQDYNDTFSGICNPELTEETKKKIVEEKENEGEFDYGGEGYKYFGTSDLCIIFKEPMSDEEILGKLDGMQYFKYDKNTISSDVKTIETDDSLIYVNKSFAPELFCPTFWSCINELSLTMLFEFTLDYNRVFDSIQDSQTKEGALSFPENLCYWDTLNQCFDFLSVLALTSVLITQENKDKILSWCQTFYSMKKTLLLWKENQLAYQRILKDFLSSFLNNSDYNRFIRLENKVEKYIQISDKLRNDTSFSSVSGFFASLPFAQMINEQFKPNVFSIAKEIQTVLRNYINGTNVNGTPADIRKVASKIYEILPMETMKNAAFPFIVPKGGLVGSYIRYNDAIQDPVSFQVQKQANRVYNLRIKKKQKEQEAAKIISDSNIIVDSFVSEYIKTKSKRKDFPRDVDIKEAIPIIQETLRKNAYDDDRTFLFGEAKRLLGKNNSWKITKNYSVDVIDKMINNMSNAGTGEVEEKKLARKRTRQVKRSAMEDDEDEKEERSSSQARSDIGVTTRRKKKKIDWDNA
jgi:hypothetical protein